MKLFSWLYYCLSFPMVRVLLMLQELFFIQWCGKYTRETIIPFYHEWKNVLKNENMGYLCPFCSSSVSYFYDAFIMSDSYPLGHSPSSLSSCRARWKVNEWWWLPLIQVPEKIIFFHSHWCCLSGWFFFFYHCGKIIKKHFSFAPNSYMFPWLNWITTPTTTRGNRHKEWHF